MKETKKYTAIFAVLILTLLIAASTTSIAKNTTTKKCELCEESKTKTLGLDQPIIGSGVVEVNLGDVSSLSTVRIGPICLYVKVMSWGPDTVNIKERTYECNDGILLFLLGFDGAFISVDENGPDEDGGQIIGVCGAAIGLCNN